MVEPAPHKGRGESSNLSGTTKYIYPARCPHGPPCECKMTRVDGLGGTCRAGKAFRGDVSVSKTEEQSSSLCACANLWCCKC